MHSKLPSFFIFLVLSFSACQKEQPNDRPAVGDTLFTRIPPAYSGLNFSNDLSYTEEFNPYTFRNFFNGGGVGIGDVNNDGLPDIYFCGNLTDNKLYLNQGDFKFTEIAQKAGVHCPDVWSSGVSMADINADGWLDIYVCKSGKPGSDNRHNELFINNADPDADGQVTFTEKSKEYGIGDEGLSTHAAFFDYDLDGDLDCYLLNNSMRPVGNYDLRKSQREIRDSLGGNKLYRNDGNKFTDVSEAAGIYGSNIGFGLGVTVGDVNRDDYPDIFVSNDFFEKDYLYLNQGDGTFKETGATYIPEMSFSSMGADMADLNNDGYPEIFVTDMLPASNARMKTKTAFENWAKYRLNKDRGYHKQFTRNVLQLNTGAVNAENEVYFSDISRMTGVHATDWSWGALIADFDNDGRKDIFVANGILKDLTDQDYVMFFSDPRNVQNLLKESGSAITQMVDKMPAEAIPNAVFRQTGKEYIPTFADVAAEWGLAQKSFSNGSAYGDLDNDGDLDLIINNINSPAFVYRNEADTLRRENHWLKTRLIGTQGNLQAIGSRVTVHAGGEIFYQEVNPMRGFESTTDARLNFGLGNHTAIDSVEIGWYDGSSQVLKNLTADQILKIKKENTSPPQKTVNAPAFFARLPASVLPFVHIENRYDDFDRDRLLYHQRSTEGPASARADVNNDGRDDLYFGGAKGQPGALLLQMPDGTFREKSQPAVAADAGSEDTDAVFFDADSDGDQDLYVASGGSEFSDFSSELYDRLYLNDGRGNFTKSPKNPFPRYASTGCVTTGDFDGDGDADLFIGERLQAGKFGLPVSGHIILNEGKGIFKPAPAWVKATEKIGFIKDAAAADLNADGKTDLIVVGEYMPVLLLKNTGNGFIPFPDTELKINAPAVTGLWNTIHLTDVNGDGQEDLVIGNYGLNSRLHAAPDRPLNLWINDLDGNGSFEQVTGFYEDTILYPLALRSDLVSQIPQAKKRFLKHEQYKNTTMRELFGAERVKNSLIYQAGTTATTLFLRQGDEFVTTPLPAAAQLSPCYAIISVDIDRDGDLDLITAGNLEGVKPELGTYTGSYGAVLENDGKGNFTALTPARSGLLLRGEVRGFTLTEYRGRKRLIVAKNNAPAEIFELR